MLSAYLNLSKKVKSFNEDDKVEKMMKYMNKFHPEYLV